MKRRFYIETSIISYLAAKPSMNVILARHQAITRQWWRHHRPTCDVFVSEIVVREAAEGDQDACRRRMETLAGIRILEATEEALELAKLLIRSRAIPAAAEDDATHVAIAAVNGMDFLLTWNCRHIANLVAAPLIRDIIEQAGYGAPTITTPKDLLISLGELP